MEIIFASAGCITGLFFMLIVLFSKTRQLNKYLLISFITVLVFSFLPILLHSFEIFPPVWLNASFGLLWGPLLYFYINSLLKENIKFKYAVIHAIPFLIFFILTVFFQLKILPPPPSDFNILIHEEIDYNGEVIFTLIQGLSLLGYSVITLFLLNKHNKNIKNYYSYRPIHLTIRWSYTIIIFFVIAYLLVAITQLLIPELVNQFPFDIHIMLISIFVYLLGYLGIQQQPVYLSMIELSKIERKVKKEEVSKEKYTKNRLNDHLKVVYKTKLVEYLDKDKPYLNPKLSIDDLSVALEIPKHFISQTINNSLNHTFYSLINFYRVTEVKERIKNDKQEKYTLLSIAFDAGFNSKSGFNKNFKLETGITPLEYRKSINN